MSINQLIKRLFTAIPYLLTVLISIPVSGQVTTLVSQPLFWETDMPWYSFQGGSPEAACQAMEDFYELTWGQPSYYNSGDDSGDACQGGGMTEIIYTGSVENGHCRMAYVSDYCGDIEEVPEFDTFYPIYANCMSGYVYEESAGACIAAQPLVEDDYPDLGPPEDCAPGNPINPANGNKIQTELDYLSGAPGSLSITRTYNSFGDWVPLDFQSPNINGKRWHNSLDLQATVFYVNRLVGSTLIPTLSRVVLLRGDGNVLTFSVEKNENDEVIWSDTLKGRHNRLETIKFLSESSFEYYRQDGAIETYQFSSDQGDFVWMSIATIDYINGSSANFAYDQNNKLTTIAQNPGPDYSFTYDSNGRINQITAPSGTVTYSYDSVGNFETVTFPDGNNKTYLYEDSNFPHALTGIIDENATRLSTYAYDSEERAVLTKRAGDTNLYTFSYNGGVESEVTDPYNVTITYEHEMVNGRLLRKSVSQLSTTCSSKSVYKGFDPDNGKVTYEVDGNFNGTSYEYDNGGTKVTVTDSLYGITVYEYLDSARPLKVARGDKLTEFQYDTQLRLESKSIKDLSTSNDQTWTFTYNTVGRLESINGPRSDVTDTTSYTYYSNGDLQSITNALSQITVYSNYTGDGRIGKITEPSGVETNFTYTLRGWLDTITRAGSSTEFDYDAAGNLIKITYPDSSIVEYLYDDAHRLTEIHDHDGNRLVYILDDAGNRIQTKAYTATNTLVFTESRTFNNLGRLHTVVGALNQTVEYRYDGNGNVTSITDGLSNQVEYYYDALNRFEGDYINALGADTYRTYSQDGMVTSISDYNYNQTNYNYNGLSQLIELISPDTGTTSYVYDDASNLTEKLDSDGRQLTYNYDALNRLTGTSGSGYNVTYSYDEESNSVGQLGTMTDNFGQTKWLYTNAGFPEEKIQTPSGGSSLSTSYAYDLAGRVQTLTYPSGHAVTYLYASNGKVSGLSLNGNTLLSGIGYTPFLGISEWLPANNVIYGRGYNLDGLVSSITYPGTTRAYTYDNAYQITAIADANFPGSSESVIYDAAGRLNSYTRDGVTTDWEYDYNGNRIAEYVGSVWRSFYISGNQTTEVYRDDLGITERTFSYDDAGHRVGGGNYSYTYNEGGRLVNIADGSSTIAAYQYNGLGQRVAKTVGAQITYYVYDEQGHVIGEYESSGISREYVWLDDIPVAMVETDSSNTRIYYIHSDHLNTPRFLTDSNGTVVWRWDGDAFGQGLADEDPDNNSDLVIFNLRFPGQLFDSETGTHYNYFRDYDPSLGRYLQSDPIGLSAGMNTYAYVNGSPIMYFDLFGLDVDLNMLPRVNSSGADLAYKNVTQVTPPPGSISVSGHGNSQSIQNRVYLMDAEALAKKIKNLPNYDADSPVYLYSCSTGEGDNSLADQLQKIIGNPVHAPQKDIKVDQNGNVSPPAETWRVFK